MQIDSTRFGPVEIDDGQILTFPDGLIGLPGARYALLARNEQLPFLWLHSIDDPELAVPVTSPWLFVSDYDVRVPDEDVRKLGLASADDVEILCVVRASGALEDFSINLAAPVVIHRGARLGHQVINESRGYSVRHPLFSEVELGDAQSAASEVSVATAI